MKVDIQYFDIDSWRVVEYGSHNNESNRTLSFLNA